MKTAIIYVSKHGTTEKTALQIQQELGKQTTELFNLKQNSKIDLTDFDQIIIGGSIHAGMIQSRIKDFYTKNMEILLQKPLGLFISCFYEGEIALTQLEKAFPEELRKHAKSSKVAGGEMLVEKMNFFERLVVKKVAGITKTESKINHENISQFISEMKN